MRLHLLDNGLDIDASEDDKYDFVMSIAYGRIDFDQIKQWIEKKIKKNEG